MGEEERNRWMARSGKEGRNARGGRKGLMTQIGRGGRNARGGKEMMDDLKWERRKELKGKKGKDG